MFRLLRAPLRRAAPRSLATHGVRAWSSRPATVSNQGKTDPSLVIFDKDGTIIDFQLMWGSWIESLAWRIEMEAGHHRTNPEVSLRELLFECLGYDWLKRVRPAAMSMAACVRGLPAVVCWA